MLIFPVQTEINPSTTPSPIFHSQLFVQSCSLARRTNSCLRCLCLRRSSDGQQVSPVDSAMSNPPISGWQEEGRSKGARLAGAAAETHFPYRCQCWRTPKVFAWLSAQNLPWAGDLRVLQTPGASSVAERRGRRRGSSHRCFQPSSLCFAMVSKFILLSCLLMIRLALLGSEPSLLWGIGPECRMEGGGEEIGLLDSSGK